MNVANDKGSLSYKTFYSRTGITHLLGCIMLYTVTFKEGSKLHVLRKNKNVSKASVTPKIYSNKHLLAIALRVPSKSNCLYQRDGLVGR